MISGGRALLLCGFGLLLGCQMPGFGKPAPRDWSEPVDYGALRSEYGDREDFAAICEDDRPFTELAEQAQAKDWQAILDISGPWLEACPVDLEVHFIRAVALKETDRAAESELHVTWYKGLVESVLASGDGRSPETAWVVISVPEEYAILRALRARQVSQTLLEEQMVDAVEVETKDGKRVTVYFAPRAHFERLRRQLDQQDE